MRRASSPFIVTIPTDVDAALKANDDLLDRQLVLQGKFKDEIERLSKIKAEAEEAAGKVKTIERAQAIHTEAEAYSVKVRADADALLAEAGCREAQAQVRIEAVVAREIAATAADKAIAAREAATTAERERLEAQAKELNRLNDERLARANQGTVQLDLKAQDFRTEMAKANAALAAREKRLNERLDALKVSDI